MNEWQVPLIIRGKIIHDQDVTFSGRHDGVMFKGPSVFKHIGDLVEQTPSRLADLYEIGFEEIVEVMQDLGERLSFGRNPYIQALDKNVGIK